MKKAAVAVAFLVFLPVLFLGILGVDASRYRGDLARAMSAELGRTVAIEGALRFGLSVREGLLLSVKGASLANAEGASRPLMAKIGQLDLGVGLIPLLKRKIVISSFSLADADIQIESRTQDGDAFDFSKVKAETSSENLPENNQPFCLRIERLKISKSRLALRSEDGSLSSLQVQNLTLRPEGQQVVIHYEGERDGIPLTVDLTGDALERLFSAPWQYKAEVTYGALNYLAHGFLKTSIKTAEVRYFRLTAGKSVVTGEARISYGGARPLVYGKVISDRLDLADLSPVKDSSQAAEPATVSGQAASKRIFSDKAFDLSSLNNFDAKIDAKIDELVLGAFSLTRFMARLDLSKGLLILSPASMMFAGGEVRGQMKVETEVSPLQLVVLLKASKMDFSQLVRMGGLESILDGKGDMDIQIASQGNSLHALASKANGQINITMANGEVDTKALGHALGTVLDMAVPGLSALTEPAINCMAGRIKIINGLMQTKGVLLDTSVATVFGIGAIHLGSEVITTRVYSKGKGSDLASLIPTVKISGALSNPDVTTEGGATLQKVAGVLMGTGAGTSAGSIFVPEVAKIPGQNACLYTLDHGSAARRDTASAGSSLFNGLSSSLSGLTGGGSMLEGLSGNGMDGLIQDLGSSLFGQ